MQILTSYNLLTNFRRQGHKNRSQHLRNHKNMQNTCRHYKKSAQIIIYYHGSEFIHRSTFENLLTSWRRSYV